MKNKILAIVGLAIGIGSAAPAWSMSPQQPHYRLEGRIWQYEGDVALGVAHLPLYFPQGLRVFASFHKIRRDFATDVNPDPNVGIYPSPDDVFPNATNSLIQTFSVAVMEPIPNINNGDPQVLKNPLNGEYYHAHRAPNSNTDNVLPSSIVIDREISSNSIKITIHTDEKLVNNQQVTETMKGIYLPNSYTNTLDYYDLTMVEAEVYLSEGASLANDGLGFAMVGGYELITDWEPFENIEFYSIADGAQNWRYYQDKIDYDKSTVTLTFANQDHDTDVLRVISFLEPYDGLRSNPNTGKEGFRTAHKANN